MFDVGMIMECEHKFDYVGDQKGAKDAARYFKCQICGIVKVRSSDGTEYIIAGAKSKSSE